MQKFKSIQLKIAFWAGLCLMLTAGVIILFSANAMRQRAEHTRETAITYAQNYAKAVAAQDANRILAILEVPLDAARTLAQTLSGIKREEVGQELGREKVHGILRTILEENPEFVGVYTAWEPNAFDGMDRDYINAEGHDETGRFIPYWSRSADGAIMVEPLVDYEQEGPGDYYQLPKKTKQECVIDPYVYPIQGEDVLITSLVVPIMVDNTFYGIAGIDLRIDTLQELVDDVEDLYKGTAQIFIISHKGTFAAVTAQPKIAGKHIKTLHVGWEQDLEYIRKGEIVAEMDEGRLAVFTPMKVGHTITPWSVNILIPKEQITADTDAQLRQAIGDVWKMAGIGVICLMIALGVLWFLASTITSPIRQAVSFAEQLAAGELSADLPLTQQGELGILAGALQTMKTKIQDVLQETNRLIQSVQDGKLDVRGNIEGFAGGWRELVTGMNNVIDAFMTPFNVTAEYLDRISKGDLPQKITDDYQGDFREVTNNLNQCIDAISGLVAETTKLTEVAVQGRFDIQGDVKNFSGDYAAIVEGMNNTIATLVGHINRIPVPVMIIDPEFTIRYINQAGSEMLGVAAEHLLDQKCYDHVKTTDCHTAKCACARAIETGNIETGETEAHPGGKDILASYTAIPLRDQGDTIIGALEIFMDQTEIKHAMSSVQEQNWLRTGQAELSNVMRGEQDVSALAKNIITYIAQYLQADIGTLYLAKDVNGNKILHLAGSHAYTRRKASENTIKVGESLAGQAAKEQESVLYSEIPEDYLPIKTEFGYEAPRNLLVSPFLYEGELKGVIEVGTTIEFTDAHVEFLKQASENIAVAFNSAQTRLRMQKLLEQSQQ